MAKEKRFVKVYEENFSMMGAVTILVDRATGAHYLLAQNSSIGGLTPLLDGEGKPVVTLEDLEEKERGPYGN